MKLKELIADIYSGILTKNFNNLDIQSITCNSKLVTKNSLFIAIKGPSCDGVDFIPEAVKNGARVIVIPNRYNKPLENKDLCFLKIQDTKKFLCEASQRFYDYPSRKIKTIGVTGTNGKTTITYLLESILTSAGKKSAVIGTVNYRIGAKTIPSKNTTPGLIENQQFLASMVQQKIEYCIMEVSSHALDQGRVDAIDFHCAIFTNLTQDHLDYHLDMEDYFRAKSLLFTRLSKKASAVINVDNLHGQRLMKLTKTNIVTYGINRKSDVTVEGLRLGFSGSEFTLVTPQGKVPLKSELIGRHNIYNILAAAAASLTQEIPLEQIAKGIESLRVVPGRLERIHCGQNFHVFVDYAHTDDALKNVLTSLKDVNKTRIILVFGCGGDRDKTKRPRMGKVADELADMTMITCDNPRSEDPQFIIEQIKQGFKKSDFLIIPDRKEAIEKALSIAKANEVVLIAGKGHETYQIFKDKTMHFDDREIVRKFLKC